MASKRRNMFYEDKKHETTEIGVNTIEDSVGSMDNMGLPNVSAETVEMGQRFKEFFRNRRPLPRSHTLPDKYTPGRISPKEAEMEGFQCSQPEAMRELTQSANAQGSEDDSKSGAQGGQAPRRRGASMYERLRAADQQHKKAPPPRANLRQNFQPTLPGNNHIPKFN
ncbi:hypothetical protein AAG570_013550 [Ranatra chinensis]|uniref:Uncharacterized protein n=1 Tax=Ranatra chinensis TaxID=642074 RepID=A0ABD0YCJ0_9HEMI